MAALAIILSACFLFSQQAQAAVVEVDVTIKSVDAKTRGITVTYEAKAGQKTIDLDVSRKATITINGSDATLDALRPGQKAKVAFEKELQVVTKIDATGSGAAPGREVYRITLQLSEFGDGKFRIEKTSQPPADDFQGTPFKFSRWPHTKATKGQDGMFRLVHDFSDADDPETLAFMPPLHVAIEKPAGLLVFRSGPLPEARDVKNGATLEYGKKWRLPLTIVLDVAEHGDAGFAIVVYGNNLGLLQCRIASHTQDLDHPFDVEIVWVEYDGKDNRKFTNLCDQKDSTLDSPFEKQLRLPLPNAKISEPVMVRLARMFGDKATKVSRLEVRGRIAPVFRMDVDEKAGTVFAKTVFPNGLAEKVGFQIGDVISAINGKRPQTRAEAVEMLSRLPIGEEAVFTIQRADKTQELRVVAE